ncbi:MAG: winged helix-turn-helix transcriptional regulator [Flavobacteriaceae bacterium]|nr:winged helix-turn-helix transcriptional regulator [Flavobacteriaceae bacterium]
MEDLEKDFSEIATLFGDKSRAIMLWNLLDGRAYTATELATCANVSLQSASNHLSKLLKKEVLTVEKQGRHRYYRLSSSEVAQVIESMASLLSIQTGYKTIKRPKMSGFTYARTCYKHLAGEVGVKITEAMVLQEIITVADKNFELTEKGKKWFTYFEIPVDNLQNLKRSFSHKCLDWSERKHHLAGALGDSFLEMMVEKDWFRKHKNTRELTLTAKGRTEIKQHLNIIL